MLGPLSGVLTPPWDITNPAPWFHGAVWITTIRSLDPFTHGPSRDRRRLHRARSPFTPAAPLFGGSRVGAYSRPGRRLTTSATNYDVRAKAATSSSNPRVREGGRDLRPGSDAARGRPLARSSVTRGELASVRVGTPHLRFLLQSRFTRSRCVPLRAAPRLAAWRRPARLATRETQRTTGARSLDRVKDVSFRRRDGRCRPRRVRTLCSRTKARSPPRRPRGHPLSSARPSQGKRPDGSVSDRPRPSFQRRPAKGAAFRKTGVPFTVASGTAP